VQHSNASGGPATHWEPQEVALDLDLYVGTLTRYYGSDGQAPDDDTRLSVLMWRDSLSLALEEHLEDPLDWDESAAAPHFTAELGWQAYSALLLWAAYAEHPELPRPEAATAEWEADPAYRASNAEGLASHYGQLLYGPELWLPCSFGFTFHAEDVCGDQVTIGSSVALLAELQASTRPPCAPRRPPERPGSTLARHKARPASKGGRATAWPFSLSRPTGRWPTACP